MRFETIKYERRGLLGVAGASLATAELGFVAPSRAAAALLGPLKQVDAGPQAFVRAILDVRDLTATERQR